MSHPQKRCNFWKRIALLPLREKGWDEGYSAQGGSLHPLTPTPLPRGERGFLNTSMRPSLPVRDV
ncbi:hypothetical protein EJ913_28405 [Azospirillum doebereinerae]|uniref:Uncharacterized protein n=1 Tax=Azospirillum doebereinerae TaxID=92933 RepID=A0A433J0L7_9PROT|nr:hypothetical protein EJ913_28405 [Azospirillum doebereinerae]